MYYFTVCLSFLLWFINVPLQLCSPVDQAKGNAENINSHLPPALLLSAVDIKKMIKDGFRDDLIQVYNSFEKIFTNVEFNENKFGSSKMLRDVIREVLTSPNVSNEIKKNLNILSNYIKEDQIRSTANTVDGPVMQDGNVCTCSERLVMVPIDFVVFKNAGLSDSLKRVVSYTNRHSVEVPFVDKYLTTDNPLLPFLMLGKHPDTDGRIKDDIKTLLPYLKTSISSYLSEASTEYYETKVIRKRRDVQNEYQSTEPAVLLNQSNELGVKKIGRVNENYKDTTQDTGNEKDTSRSKQSKANLDDTGTNNSNLDLSFYIMKTSENVIKNLKKDFSAFQSKFSEALQFIQEKTQNAKDMVSRLFSDYNNMTDVTKLPGNSDKPNGENINTSDLVSELKSVCVEHNTKPGYHLMTQKIVEILVQHLASCANVDEHLERDIKSVLSENCGLRESSPALFQSSPRVYLSVRNERLSAKSNNINTDVDDVIGAYSLPSEIMKENLKNDVRRLVDKCNEHCSSKSTCEYNTELYNEIKLLPVDAHKLVESGHYSNLLRLHEYLKKQSYDDIILTPKSTAEKISSMKDILDIIQRSSDVSEEIKKDATLVKDYIFVAAPTITITPLQSPQTKPFITSSRIIESHTRSLDMYDYIASWPIEITEMILDGSEGSLQRVYRHLHDHYQDLLISTQKTEYQRNVVLREVLQNIIHSDQESNDLQNDARITLSYVKPLKRRKEPNKDNNSDTVVMNNELYPLDFQGITSNGLSDSMERVFNLCKKQSYDEILRNVKNSPKKSETFRQLLEVLKSFNDTDDQLKKDIDSVSKFIVDKSAIDQQTSVARRSLTYRLRKFRR